MASYVDPGLYANREDMQLKICTSCGSIIHKMSIPVHDNFHKTLEDKGNVNPA